MKKIFLALAIFLSSSAAHACILGISDPGEWTAPFPPQPDIPVYQPGYLVNFTGIDCWEDEQEKRWRQDGWNEGLPFSTPGNTYSFVTGAGYFQLRGNYVVGAYGNIYRQVSFIIGAPPNPPEIVPGECLHNPETDEHIGVFQIVNPDTDVQEFNSFEHNLFVADGFGTVESTQTTENPYGVMTAYVPYINPGPGTIQGYTWKTYRPRGSRHWEAKLPSQMSGALEYTCKGVVYAQAPNSIKTYKGFPGATQIEWKDSTYGDVTFQVEDQAKNGVVTVSESGEVQYTSHGNFFGADSATIKVTNQFEAERIVPIVIQVMDGVCPQTQSQWDVLAKKGVKITHDAQGQTCGPPPMRNEDGEGLTSCQDCQKALGHPVNISTGAMWHPQLDFEVKSRTPETTLKLSRMYTSSATGPVGDFGPNWHHNWETKLVIASDQGTPKDVVWVDTMGGSWEFRLGLENTYRSPGGQKAKLVKLEDHFEIRSPDKSAYHFSLTGKLTQFVDKRGEVVSLTYDENEQLQSISVPFAGTVTFTRNEQGRIASATRVRDNLTYTYEYDQDGKLIRATDFANLSYLYSYVSDMPDTAAQGMLSTVTDPLNRVLRFTYHSDGRAYQQFEPGGGAWTFTYKDPGTLAKARKRKKKPTAGTAVRFTQVKQPDGQTITYAFDAAYREVEEWFGDGSRTKKTWSPRGRLASTTDELGATTQILAYDDNLNITSMRRPEDSGPTLTVYDQTFNAPTLVTPPIGASTQYTLDPNTGDVMRVERNDGATTLALDYTRDAFGNLLSTNNGRTTYANQTDSNGLLTHVFDSFNPETRTYDARGRVETRSFQSGRVMQFTYDDYDRVLTIADSHGPETVNTFDVMGRMLSRTMSDNGANSQITSFVWDANDRLVSETDAMGRTTKYVYETRRIRKDPKKIIDPAGRVTEFTYDDRGRKVAEKDPRGRVTHFSYNSRGDLVSVTDPEGNTTHFQYDGNRRKVSESRPSIVNGNREQRLITYQYDDKDRVIEEVHHSASGGDARRIEFIYDAFDRMTERRIWNGANVEDYAAYSYENQLDAQVMTAANNGAAELSFSPIAAPPFVNSSFGVNGASGNYLNLVQDQFTLSRGVTGEISNVSGQSFGQVFSRSYDAAGRLTGVNAGAITAAISYDGFGRKSGISYSDGTAGQISYDPLNRVVGMEWKEKHKSSVQQQLYYDLAGNITKMSRENGVYTLKYDANNQLVQSRFKGMQGVPAYNRDWQYDGVGNRLQDSENGAGTFVSNFLTQNSVSAFAADADGLGQVISETTGDKVKNFTYRADGKIAGYSQGNLFVSYVYDALDRLVAKIVNDNGNTYTQTITHLDLENRALLAKAGDGAITVHFDGQGMAERLGEVKNGVGKAYMTDHLGSVLNSPLAGAHKMYGLFGEANGKVELSPSAKPVVYGFTGHLVDAESGLNRTEFRQYHQATGRWMSQEPYGMDGPNFYKYTLNNPVIYLDSNGLYTLGQGVAVLAGGAAAGAAAGLAVSLIPGGQVAAVPVFFAVGAATSGCILYSQVGNDVKDWFKK